MFIDYTRQESGQAPPEQLHFALWFYSFQGFSGMTQMRTESPEAEESTCKIDSLLTYLNLGLG